MLIYGQPNLYWYFIQFLEGIFERKLIERR